MTDESRVPPDQASRDLIITELDTNMLVEAAAGTGKTASMVGRMVELLRKGNCGDIRTMAAVTFTRKAAAELRARFQVALEKAVREAEGEERERLARSLANIEQCFTGTIHSFCGRLLRERPVEANVDIAFEEIDEDIDSALRSEAWSEYCARLLTGGSEGRLAELDSLGIRLADLEQAFYSYSLYPDVDRWPAPGGDRGPVGLEQAVTELDSYIEHMRRAAPDLPRDSGSDTLMPALRDMPRIVSHYDDLGDARQLMEVLERFDRGVKVTLKQWAKAGYDRDAAKAEWARWEEFRQAVASPLVRSWRESRYEPVMQVMSGARRLCDELRAERGQLNFQDLLMKAAGLLRGSPHVRGYFRGRFTHLLVDEFQDTDPIQAEVMLLLTATDPTQTDWRKCRPRPGSLFVVGDPKQSIYRFRRADIVTYEEVKEIILAPDGGAPGALVRLSANFRTVEPLIDWVNEVFEPGGEAAGEGGPGVMLRFPADESEQSPAYVAIEHGRREGNPGGLSGVFTMAIDEGEGNKGEATEYEADFIARFIRKAIDTGMTVPRTLDQLASGAVPEVDPSDFLIITRYRAGLSVYAARLQEYGVPHQVTGGTALNEVAELGLLRACLTAVARPDDPVALVAALRGEAFGISDAALYRFKKAAGRFNYNSPVPGALATEDREAFGDTFDRLRKYHRWLSTLPAVSAIENIVADLGLMVLASAHRGGDVQAGSLGKALELLRAVQHDDWAAVQLVRYLGQVVDMRQKYDGMSARSRETPVVRVMNLHKVKGLEAPVVFLANAFGEATHAVDLFIDRSGSEVLGYMAVRGKSAGRRAGRLLAHPEGWEALAEREGAFGVAEDLRLRYVAATRAGCAMVVTERPLPSLNRWNAWRHFQALLPAQNVLEDPGERKAPPRESVAISAEEAADAVAGIAARLDRAEAPTYDVRAAKEFALSTAEQASTGGPSAGSVEPPPGGQAQEVAPPLSAEGEFGVEWGQAVHELLELAMLRPGADVLAWAATVLAENGIDISFAQAAADTVASVTGSDIWRRALASERRLTEVPFEIMLEDTEPPTLIRGAIDLVFAEEDGWVLVDFKTDTVRSPSDVEALISKYAPQLRLYGEAWERCTGQGVIETGLYLVRTGEFRHGEST